MGELAGVLPLAAVADGMATHVVMAQGVQGAELTVAHAGGPHHVDQAPARNRGGRAGL